MYPTNQQKKNYNIQKSILLIDVLSLVIFFCSGSVFVVVIIIIIIIPVYK